MRTEEEIRLQRLRVDRVISESKEISRELEKSYGEDWINAVGFGQGWFDLLASLTANLDAFTWVLEEGRGLLLERYITWAKYVGRISKGEKDVSKKVAAIIEGMSEEIHKEVKNLARQIIKDQTKYRSRCEGGKDEERARDYQEPDRKAKKN